MKSTNVLFRTISAAVLICLLLLAAALADGASPAVSIQGTAGQYAEFYVFAQTDTTLVISQDRSVLQRQSGLRNAAYAGFDIAYYNVNQPGFGSTATLEGASVTLRLARNTYYKVTLTPYTMERMTARDTYLGYPGSYERWLTPAKWSVTSADGCRLSTAPMTATAAPAYIPGYPYTPASTYVPQTTASPSVTIPVYYLLANGTQLSQETVTLAPGTHYVFSKFTHPYFTLIGSPYQAVTVYANGQASQSSVTFYFQFNAGQSTPLPTATPTPVPTSTPSPVPQTAMVPVYYLLADGSTIGYEVRVLQPGNHVIWYDNRYAGMSSLRLTSPSIQYVTVYANGTAYPASVTFTFSSGGGNAALLPFYSTAAPLVYYTSTPVPRSEAETDQEAIIGAAKIFPRPKPGKGKNEFNYASAGQKVTVHSKALSLQNDGTWWVCISGTVTDYGKPYTLDHVWIRVDYLNQRSFDLDKVPLDPEYM